MTTLAQLSKRKITMGDKNMEKPSNDQINSAANAPDPSKQIVVNTQYVKDLSFENPTAPVSLVAPKGKPNIDLSVDIKAQALQEKTFEVTLHITAKATVEEKPLFLVDLAYSGVFTLSAIDEKDKEPVLLVYCPNMLFPFARRVIADTTRDGGFPPLMIDPIDFFTLYQKRVSETQAEKKEAVVS